MSWVLQRENGGQGQPRGQGELPHLAQSDTHAFWGASLVPLGALAPLHSMACGLVCLPPSASPVWFKVQPADLGSGVLLQLIVLNMPWNHACCWTWSGQTEPSGVSLDFLVPNTGLTAFKLLSTLPLECVQCLVPTFVLAQFGVTVGSQQECYIARSDGGSGFHVRPRVSLPNRGWKPCICPTLLLALTAGFLMGEKSQAFLLRVGSLLPAHFQRTCLEIASHKQHCRVWGGAGLSGPI